MKKIKLIVLPMLAIILMAATNKNHVCKYEGGKDCSGSVTSETVEVKDGGTYTPSGCTEGTVAKCKHCGKDDPDEATHSLAYSPSEIDLGTPGEHAVEAYCTTCKKSFIGTITVQSGGSAGIKLTGSKGNLVLGKSYTYNAAYTGNYSSPYIPSLTMGNKTVDAYSITSKFMTEGSHRISALGRATLNGQHRFCGYDLTVNVKSDLELSISGVDQVLCDMEYTWTAVATGGGGDYTFEWGDGSTGDSFEMEIASSGGNQEVVNKEITVTVTDSYGFKRTASINVSTGPTTWSYSYPDGTDWIKSGYKIGTATASKPADPSNTQALASFTASKTKGVVVSLNLKLLGISLAQSENKSFVAYSENINFSGRESNDIANIDIFEMTRTVAFTQTLGNGHPNYYVGKDLSYTNGTLYWSKVK